METRPDLVYRDVMLVLFFAEFRRRFGFQMDTFSLLLIYSSVLVNLHSPIDGRKKIGTLKLNIELSLLGSNRVCLGFGE